MGGVSTVAQGRGPTGDEAQAPPSWDAPGGLQIREARSWATWHLAASILAAAIVGMIIGYSGKKPAAQSAAGQSTFQLGGPSVTKAPNAGSGATRTQGSIPTDGSTGVAPGLPSSPATSTSSTSTSIAPAAPPTSPASNAVAAVLVPKVTGTGPEQLQAFTTGGPWQIGWAFDCVGAPAGSASFAIDVVPKVAGTTTSAVHQTARNGQGVSPEGTSGQFHLQVTTDPACRWAVKVTGVAG